MLARVYSSYRYTLAITYTYCPPVAFSFWSTLAWTFEKTIIETEIVYMCSSLLELAPGSCDLSQAEKKAPVVKPEPQ